MKTLQKNLPTVLKFDKAYAGSACRRIRVSGRGACLAIFLLLISAVVVAKSAEKISPAAAWPIFRGDRQLTGQSNSRTPANPVLKWEFATGDSLAASPAVDAELVYIGSTNGSLYALDREKGKKIWEFKTDSSFEAPPMLLRDTVYIGALNGEMFAVDKANGELRWSYKTGNRIMGSANWAENSKGQVVIVVGSYDFKIYGLAEESGRELWAYKTGNYINGAPAISVDGRIVAGGCDSFLHVVKAVDGTSAGNIEIGSYIAGSAALAGQRAYVGHYDNQVVGADLETGKIVWTYGDADNGSPFFSSPALTEKKVFIGSRDGYLHCINRDSGEGIWTFPTGGDVDSSPVVMVDKHVVFGSSDGRIYIVQQETGKKVWAYEIGAEILPGPAVAEGWIYVAADDGRLYAFGDKP